MSRHLRAMTSSGHETQAWTPTPAAPASGWWRSLSWVSGTVLTGPPVGPQLEWAGSCTNTQWPLGRILGSESRATPHSLQVGTPAGPPKREPPTGELPTTWTQQLLWTQTLPSAHPARRVCPGGRGCAAWGAQAPGWKLQNRRDTRAHVQAANAAAEEVRSDAVKSDNAQEPGMLGPRNRANWKWSNRRCQEWALTF